MNDVLPSPVTVQVAGGFVAPAERGYADEVVGSLCRRAGSARGRVVLVDIDLGPESGLDLARQLAAESGWHGTKVILISTHSAEDFADLITASPAIGFLPKSQLSGTAVEELLAESGSSDDR